MSEITLRINGQDHQLDMSPETPLLWALRDHLDMVGTKYGCGVGLCGSCTVLVDGDPVRSCTTPAAGLVGMEITTIEGFHPEGGHPVQRAWNDVAQCGYCQGGQILSAAALLEKDPAPSDEDIDKAMAGNICRCGTYPRIRKAVKLASEYMAEGDES